MSWTFYWYGTRSPAANRICSLSLDIFIQAFRHGDAREVDAKMLREALAPYLFEIERGWNLRSGNSEAEIYGVEDLASGFMVTRIDGAQIYDVLVRVAAACDLVIMPVGVFVAITRREQLEDLPDVLQGDAVLVVSGAELIALIESS